MLSCCFLILTNIDNLGYYYDVIYKRITTLFLNNAEFAVDTFFVLRFVLF